MGTAALHRHRTRATALFVVTSIVAAMTLLGATQRAEAAPLQAGIGSDHVKDAALQPDAARQARAGHYSNTGQIGDVNVWPAYTVDDDGIGSYYLKDFRLRGLSTHAELWVASADDGLDYPAGDCRNGRGFSTVTDAQITYLLDQFETVIRPREGDVFGFPVKRNGKNALLPRFFSAIPATAYRAPGDRLVILVDNFRDGEFRTPGGQSLGGGFVSSAQMSYVDRNIVNLHGRGWAWLLGSHPDAAIASHDPCTEMISLRNYLEYGLAHEYNHVLQAGAGPNSENFANDPSWILEGLATWVGAHLGYIDTTAMTDERSILVRCFLGDAYMNAPNYLYRCPGGPDHSLTTSIWEPDQSRPAGYAAAMTFFLFLDGRYGHGFLSDVLHTTGVYGMDKIDALLQQRGIAATFDDLVVDWASSMALDGVLDDGAALLGGAASRFQVPRLHATVTWDSPWAVGHAGYFRGISPNGSAFARFQDAQGGWLDAASLQSLDFDADTFLECRWVTDADGHGTGNAAMYSGIANEQNRGIARAIDVPVDNPTLAFEARYDIEPGWDFGYTQISDDNGETWHSVATTHTTTAFEDGAWPEIIADLPGLTGNSNGWVHEEADLSQWAGQHVLLGFRYRTDPAVLGQGFWVDDVFVGGQQVGDGTLAGWQQVRPRVYKMALRLISYTDDHTLASIADVPLDANNDAHLSQAQLQTMIAPGAQTVAAVITLLQNNPRIPCPLLYTLSVNGVLQPEGPPGPGA
jgi:hypothetical protein